MAEKETSKTESTESLTLVEKILKDGGMINDPSQSNYAKMIGQFAGQILDEGMIFYPDKGIVSMVNERVAEIDNMISDQLNEIMHDEKFQALESNWTGLKDMVFGTETSTRLKLRH